MAQQNAIVVPEALDAGTRTMAANLFHDQITEMRRKKRCACCQQQFTPWDNLGQWRCRVHTGNYEARTDTWSCCRLAQHSIAPGGGRVVTETPVERSGSLRGCHASDHHEFAYAWPDDERQHKLPVALLLMMDRRPRKESLGELHPVWGTESVIDPDLIVQDELNLLASTVTVRRIGGPIYREAREIDAQLSQQAKLHMGPGREPAPDDGGVA